MAKILGLDIGEKKIGVAISDDSQTLASPLCVLDNKESICSLLKKICKEIGVLLVVVGRPRNMNGSLGFQAEKVRQITEKCFSKLNVSFTFEDETGTTKLAKEKMKKEKMKPREIKEKIDSYAATIILQSYLNSLKQ